MFQYNNPIQKEFRNGGKELIKSRWDNKTSQVLQIVSGGSMFAFSVTLNNHKGKSKYWELTFWDVSGNISVFATTTPVIDEETDIIPKEKLETIVKNLLDYSNGYIRCTRCKKQIKQSEIAGQYFAGKYCDDCWNNGGVKEQEARETYD